ncbi:hypothetical protein BKA83DRAFT_685580 [Pisolithus microcarpus]|nr:hypothetical protein BKA83DRAFT_685580 [Pisolithus microcarpus]
MSDNLYDVLQSEYCPPLDTSLLVALIADLQLGGKNGLSPSHDQVAGLRDNLNQLASQATEQYESELCDELDSAHLSSQCLSTDDSCSSPGYFGETTESIASESSVISNQSFSSPLGFLQAALPHIPPSKLRRALSEAGSSDLSSIDMESIIESLSTKEYIRELEERGLVGLDEEDLSRSIRDEETWHRIDIRQRQHIPSSARGSVSAQVPDVWTQLSSISEYLASLLPPNSPKFFQSYFHSPKYTTPARAVRAALSDIAGKITESANHTRSPDSGNTSVLFGLLDIIRESPTYAELEPAQRSIVYSDTQLALSATRGRGDDSLDIISLLLGLELDVQTGSLAMGVYHLPQSPLSPTSSSACLSSPASPSKSPIWVTNGVSHSPPVTKRVPHSPTKAGHSNALNWQTVTSRKPPPDNRSRSLSLSIPAQWKSLIRGTGNGFGKGGKGDVGELTSARGNMRRHLTESWRKENELLREASRAWRSGNSKSRGGEIAQYFAERARETRELSKRDALNEARKMVDTKRYKCSDPNTLDIHGTSVWEATTNSKPFKIITGRGNHSANGVGVLKPAVRDGWNVSVWEGGLVVRGRGP